MTKSRTATYRQTSSTDPSYVDDRLGMSQVRQNNQALQDLLEEEEPKKKQGLDTSQLQNRAGQEYLKKLRNKGDLAGGGNTNAAGDFGSLENVTAESLEGSSVTGGGEAAGAGAEAGGGPTLGGAATVLAIIAAADAVRNEEGELDRPYEKRSPWGKFTSAPVTGGPAGLVDALGFDDSNVFAKGTNRLAMREEKLAGEPLDEAFRGNIGESFEKFGDAIIDAPGDWWQIVKSAVGLA